MLGSARGADSFGGASGRFGAGEEGLPWNQPGSGTVSTFGKGYNAYASKRQVLERQMRALKVVKAALAAVRALGRTPALESHLQFKRQRHWIIKRATGFTTTGSETAQ